MNDDKCISTPTTSIQWLGRSMTTTSASITINPQLPAHLCQQLAVLHYSRLDRRGLQKLLGSVQWISGPASLNAAHLASAYHLLSKRIYPLPSPITYSILNALLTALLPTFPRKLPPPLTMPIVFTDAAQVPFSPYYRVASTHPHTYATATLAPAWVRTQHQAELYGAFHGIRQAILRGLCYLCLVTDNSVYCTLKYGKISARCPTRLRILRRIYRLLYQSQCKIQLLLIPSSKNIADPFSRGLLQPPLPHSVYDNTVPYIRYCHTPTRLWCH